MNKMISKIKEFIKKNKKWLASVLVICLIGSVAALCKHFLKSEPQEPVMLYGMDMEDYDTYWESKKDIPSDIEGLSVYDKHQMGLLAYEGSDTDGDGLSDKEEIEVYGTDPLKASTAGDLYTDKYKVENSLNPLTKVEYEADYEFPFINCQEVTITPSSPIHFNTAVNDITNRYTNLSDFGLDEVFKGYELYNYSGKLSIDVSDVIEKDSKFKVYIGSGSFLINKEITPLQACEYSRSDDVITIDYEFDEEETYLIYLAKEKSSFSFINGIIDGFDPTHKTDIENISGNDSAEALIYGVPLFNYFGAKVHVDHTECYDKDNTNRFQSDTSDFIDNRILGAGVKYKKNYVEKTADAISIKKKIFEKILGIFKYTPGGKSSVLTVFFYWSEYRKGYESRTLRDRTNPFYKRVSTGFEIYEDELPFHNFASDIATGGNCVGIAHLTSSLYNNKTMPSSGSFKGIVRGKEYDIEWDISDKTNTTLLDPGIYDYKSKDFVEAKGDGKSLDKDSLIKEEEQFVNMIGAYWAEGNSKINLNDYSKKSGERLDIAVLNRIIKELDNGKVLDLTMNFSEGGAHMVNIYGYEWFDTDALRLLIYDSNIPQDNREGYDVNNVNKVNYCSVQCVIHIDKAGNETFDYIYCPAQNCKKYISTSAKNVMPYYSFVVSDDNWNVIAGEKNF